MAQDSLLQLKGVDAHYGKIQALADINRDGSVTPNDALCILQEFLQVASCLG